MIPHVTLLYPWVDGDAPLGEPMEALATVLGGFTAFEAGFRRLARFTDGQAVTYAEPEPAEPFIAITHSLSATFGIQPYGGAHATVIPHMTVASIGSVAGLDAIEREARPMLPIRARVDAAEVWAKRDGAWRLAGRVALGTPG